jgi:hypothetical protein
MALEARRGTCYLVRVTVRHAVLPIAAVLILGLGVYLFVEVRAQSAPPQIDRPARVPRPSPAAMQQTAAVHDAAAVAAPRPSSSDRPVAPAGPSRSPGAAETPSVIIGTREDRNANIAQPKVDAIMDEANKAYDHGDLEDAKIIAARVLANDPTNVRMLRVMVSASCQDGENVVAQTHFAKLPPGDQEQMRTRCARFGITFPATP